MLDELVNLLIRCLQQQTAPQLAHVAAESLLHLVQETGASFTQVSTRPFGPTHHPLTTPWGQLLGGGALGLGGNSLGAIPWGQFLGGNSWERLRPAPESPRRA